MSSNLVQALHPTKVLPWEGPRHTTDIASDPMFCWQPLWFIWCCHHQCCARELLAKTETHPYLILCMPDGFHMAWMVGCHKHILAITYSHYIGHLIVQLWMIFRPFNSDHFLAYVQHFDVIPQCGHPIHPRMGTHLLRHAVKPDGMYIPISGISFPFHWFSHPFTLSLILVMSHTIVWHVRAVTSCRQSSGWINIGLRSSTMHCRLDL